ncbi:MAG: ketoacyl-ACP synthase III [Bacteroidetes bacterium]|nr:ketoacyl-ACP synthase III [Bacteroidota bacterium]
MSFLEIKNVSIKGVSGCVPSTTDLNESLSIFTGEEAHKFIESTGVAERHVSNINTTTADLCFYAAEKLIGELHWDPTDIDCLIFVTQTPDYILPATSNLLQFRLGLSQNTFALDISSGCSGWVYGLSVISSLLSSGNFRKGLLLTGDTISKICSDLDKSTQPLFGDAGTATALEFDNKSSGLKFHFGSDGDGYQAIIIPDGGFRSVTSPDSFITEKIESGISRNRTNLILDGMNVFSFGINKAPESVRALMEYYGLTDEEVDYYLFHQANRYMNEKIRKKLKISELKVPYSLRNYGNTSSASIPITLINSLKEVAQTNQLNLLACGFGVGLSWGSVYFNTENLCIPEIINI